MEIPFIRVFPIGPPMVQKIHRSNEIERLAHIFLRSGGRYLMTVHNKTDPKEPTVELVAAIPAATVEGHVRVCEAWCHDDPALPQAIDQLVRDSVDRDRTKPALVN